MSENDKGLEWLNGLVKAVAVEQARSMVQHFILRDLVIQIAQAQGNPDAYVAAMFERVSTLVDQCELAGKPEVEAEMRWYAEQFFTQAGNSANRP
ncbi:hypothetical protein [Xanthobacter agilis]|jgi:hypothetical protein|uniref:Uncharacterized protein n=1 Tax=Xanthobacter agilis TaxID=47492 RepID=A0ABU0LFV8_XANAG|nr:hypothetical protein [Xanthobacter agilis]MDQ0506016.1 hypothetical protein [Xanthobacter agilis]